MMKVTILPVFPKGALDPNKGDATVARADVMITAAKCQTIHIKLCCVIRILDSAKIRVSNVCVEVLSFDQQTSWLRIHAQKDIYDHFVCSHWCVL